MAVGGGRGGARSAGHRLWRQGHIYNRVAGCGGERKKSMGRIRRKWAWSGRGVRRPIRPTRLEYSTLCLMASAARTHFTLWGGKTPV
jgi:hypothetical protein